ncbi:hypothetical protein J1782_25150 [Rahnella sp. BCC 1045]|uniref:hypothetical protein n=1 Tax=Rahnella sp. BCC 1045 TaxID=2816251 RepID=UPI001C25E49B|nr:hypothetical protein [Rahnella sp. BCC 1045]MBU9823182.1 hypothetical protein [Rahnella sp. BCC 1045]
MAKVYAHIGLKAKWWVKPYLLCCKAAAYSRLLREKHIDGVTRFIVENGFNIIAR